jgi:protocatechuate 3,4-dioxygenase beta subunit
MTRPNWAASSIALALLLSPPALRAQAVSGTILGTVQDSSGAAVPGASVTIVNSETRLTRSVVSDSTGEYNVPSLPPGMYNLSGEMKGFKKVSIAGVRVCG